MIYHFGNIQKALVFFLCFYFSLQWALAQDSLQFRVILIGDAGEINATQQQVLDNAIEKNIPGKTIALFLGDNIYPKGVELSGEKKELSLATLRSQFTELRRNNIPVYFIPGNHDWDKSGKNGYEKIIAVNKFIDSFNDAQLQVVPKNACPGPYELAISDRLVIIVMDTEWWLYPYDKHIVKPGCTCKSKTGIIDSLNNMVQRNNERIIIFATHHPFETYGSHGGYYTVKQHLFPLIELKKELWIPLPVIGSLYPLLRKAFPPAQDLGNKNYKDLKKRINQVLKTHPNVIHVAGHEHSLQLINGEILQVVSGAGCKHTPVKKGRGSIYATAKAGYVLADVMNDNNIKLSFFTYEENKTSEDFIYTRQYISPVKEESQQK